MGPNWLLGQEQFPGGSTHSVSQLPLLPLLHCVCQYRLQVLQPQYYSGERIASHPSGSRPRQWLLTYLAVDLHSSLHLVEHSSNIIYPQIYSERIYMHIYLLFLLKGMLEIVWLIEAAVYCRPCNTTLSKLQWRPRLTLLRALKCFNGVWAGSHALLLLPTVQVDQSGLGLPSRDYYLNKTANAKVLTGGCTMAQGV
jgi:hypothetical protein